MNKKFILFIFQFLFCISAVNLSNVNLAKLKNNGKIEACFFSPDDKITDILLKLISEEKECIQIAMYYLSDARIINELITAHKRRVKIYIIIDTICVTKHNMHNLHKLAQEGIIPMVYKTKDATKGGGALMHNKYMILYRNFENRRILATGSFNYTYTANKRNKENIIFTETGSFISKFIENFAKLREQALELTNTRQYLRWIARLPK
ncbi:hypothetical protein A3F66_06700 [candidate division TM6 bacterium RIFCSPHIGHO2_12_FULL_32_22]|nr:MAG: hypothetical protein A3F66_06700 [candidate division TM6 bacterium RIFCSPHIGHO2_12_FULL_32_22]